MNLHVAIGKRPSLKIGVGDWSAQVEAGSDFEGGSLATAKITRVVRRFGRADELTWLGFHAANGKHSRWVWFGPAGQRMIGNWRVAWWLPKRRDIRAEIPPKVA